MRTRTGFLAAVTLTLSMGLLLAGCSSSKGSGGGSGSGYTIGGTITGLTANGLVLSTTSGQSQNGTQMETPPSGTTSFTFPDALATGTNYTVTVTTQPTGETCTVANGSGTVGSSDVTNVQVSCSPNSGGGSTYTIGGTVSGLSANGLTLATNGQTVSLSSGATSFTFPTPVASGTSYAVTVTTQPTGETCTVANGSGTVSSANVTNVQVTCTTSSPISGANNAELKGTYAFLAEGWVDGVDAGSSSKMAMVGSLVADGNGNITSGAADVTSIYGSYTVSITGTYALPTDNLGQMTLVMQGGPKTSQTITVAFSAGTVQGGVATAGSIIEFDDTTGIGSTPGGQRFTGVLSMQTPSDFSAASLNGGYVFGLQGETCPVYLFPGGPTPNASCSATPTEGVLDVAGTMTFSGTGTVSSGMEDIGLDDGNCPNNICTSPVTYAQATFSGTYGTPDPSTGRTTLTMTVPSALPSTTQNIWPTNYVAYIVNSSKIYILSAQSHLSSTLMAGTAHQSSISSFTNANLNGNVVIYEVQANDSPGWGTSSYAPTSETVIGLVNANGSTGALSGTLQRNDSGTQQPPTSISSATFSVASNGRVTIGGSGSQPPVFYLDGTGSGLGIAEGGAPGLFTMEPQTATTVGNGTYVGEFLSNSTDSDSIADLISFNSGSGSSLSANSGSDGRLSWGSTKSGTYTVDSTGLITVSSNGSTSLGYVISSSKIVLADSAGTGNTSPGITAMKQ